MYRFIKHSETKQLCTSSRKAKLSSDQSKSTMERNDFTTVQFYDRFYGLWVCVGQRTTIPELGE